MVKEWKLGFSVLFEIAIKFLTVNSNDFNLIIVKKSTLRKRHLLKLLKTKKGVFFSSKLQFFKGTYFMFKIRDFYFLTFYIFYFETLKKSLLRSMKPTTVHLWLKLMLFFRKHVKSLNLCTNIFFSKKELSILRFQSRDWSFYIRGHTQTT